MTGPGYDDGRQQRSDADLLRAHVDGDPDAFGTLFARHRDRLWAVALRTLGNPEDAADGLQDGLVAAYRRAGSFRGDAAVTTWLHRVVVNACLDRARAARVRAGEPLPSTDALGSGTGAGTGVGPRPPEDPAEVTEDHERRRTVLAALAELPLEQRAALVLVDMEGYPVAEAAAILGCAAGTVKSRCSRGRARVAVRLGFLAAGGDVSTDPGNPPSTRAVPSTGAPRGPPDRPDD